MLVQASKMEAVQRYKLRKKVMAAVIAVIVLSSTACSSSLVMQTYANIPTPSVTSWPVNAAVLCEQQTCSHVYSENTSSRPNWEVTTGPSHKKLLHQALSPLFLSTTLVDSLDDVSTKTDFVITPTLQDTQFSLPSETNLKHYEAWFKYSVSIMSIDGEVVTSFPVSGYGTAENTVFKNNQQGLQLAANMALRDLAAKLILGIKQHPKIKAKLVNNVNGHRK